MRLKFSTKTVSSLRALFEARGYHVGYQTNQQLRFEDSDGVIRIRFELHSPWHPPAGILGPAVYGIDRGAWKTPPSSVDVDFNMRVGDRIAWISTKLFQPPLEPLAAFVHTPEDIQTQSLQLARRAFSEVIPYMEQAAARLAVPSDELYCALAQDPVERARRFSREAGLPIQADQCTLAALKDHLDALLPQQDDLYRSCFQQHQQHLLDLAAFSGEAVRQKYGGEWRWYRPGQAPALQDSFQLWLPQRASEYGDFDPLRLVILHWNFSAKIPWYGVESSFSSCFLERAGPPPGA